jgi:hypothetical protein
LSSGLWNDHDRRQIVAYDANQGYGHDRGEDGKDYCLSGIHAHKLMGCADEPDSTLELIANTVDAYELKRWPKGKVPGGKD